MKVKSLTKSHKVRLFWEGHKILRNLQLLLSTVHTDKSKLEILQNFAAFSEYMNFTSVRLDWGNLQNLNKAAVNSFLLPTHHTIAAQFMCVEATQIAGSILPGRQKLGQLLLQIFSEKYSEPVPLKDLILLLNPKYDFLGTIHILRNHIFRIFGPPSPPT
jgi:hypothetical protein